MPTERLSMRRIRDLLRLKFAQGMSDRAIAGSLGLRLRAHSQNNTIAARAQADRKMSARLSNRIATLRQSFMRPNIFSIL